MEPPGTINGLAVQEFGYFPYPLLPRGYAPPKDGNVLLPPVRNLAICLADGVEGYYLLFCTADWEYVTYCFCETLEAIKRVPLIEFGQGVAEWQKSARPSATSRKF